MRQGTAYAVKRRADTGGYRKRHPADRALPDWKPPIASLLARKTPRVTAGADHLPLPAGEWAAGNEAHQHGQDLLRALTHRRPNGHPLMGGFSLKQANHFLWKGKYTI